MKLISHLSDSDRCEMQLHIGPLYVCGCGVNGFERVGGGVCVGVRMG